MGRLGARDRRAECSDSVAEQRAEIDRPEACAAEGDAREVGERALPAGVDIGALEEAPEEEAAAEVEVAAGGEEVKVT